MLTILIKDEQNWFILSTISIYLLITRLLMQLPLGWGVAAQYTEK